jgi:exonuclease III
VKVLSWNTQSTKSCDNHFYFERVVVVINDFCDLDVIFLQEVSWFIQDYNGDDQKQRFEDNFLASPRLASKVIDFSVNTKITVSDHQPIFWALA